MHRPQPPSIDPSLTSSPPRQYHQVNTGYDHPQHPITPHMSNNSHGGPSSMMPGNQQFYQYGGGGPESASNNGWATVPSPIFPPPPQSYNASPQTGWYPHNVPGPSSGPAYHPPPGSSMAGSNPPSSPFSAPPPHAAQYRHHPYGSSPFMPHATGPSGYDAPMNGFEPGPSHTPDTDPGVKRESLPGMGLPEKGAGTKKKRKKNAEREASAGSVDAEKEKRVKTGRACDACRSKKIRCDILPSSEFVIEDQPICAHCKQCNLECTFFLPITETRFKKKRNQDTDTANVPGSAVPGPSSPVRPAGEVPARMEAEGPTSLSFLLHTSLPASASEAYDLKHHHSWEVSDDGNGIIRVKAPPNSAASSALAASAATNGAATGRGPEGNAGSSRQDTGDADDPVKTHHTLNRPVLNAHTISQLVNAYFDHLSHLFPIISRAEFAAKSNPPPLLLYSICGVGATQRQFPREIFAGVRGLINGMLRSNDILSDARLENVQALLILAQVGDLHAQPAAATASASLLRTGAAIRMAQDLGLHRESHLRAQTPQDLAYVELRRRIWATCVIMDRWYGAALGIPLQIDLLDCDVLLPAGYDIVPDQDPSTWPVEPSFVALSEHLKLSILVGRVLKTIYSPTGLKHATDEQLYSLLEDMRGWKEDLPDDLKFVGVESSSASGEVLHPTARFPSRWITEAPSRNSESLRMRNWLQRGNQGFLVREISADSLGLLQLAYATLHFLFWRPFMRITYICPPHLKFALQSSHWSDMIGWSTEALQWLDHNDHSFDTLFIFPYAATSCALAQYHNWVRRRDAASLETLKMVRETATRWEVAVQPDQMSIRRKTCETMTLLYEAALKTNPDNEDRPPAINPTAGVQPRQKIGKAVWIKDDAKPLGGIWVASDPKELQESGLHTNDVITASDMGRSRQPKSDDESGAGGTRMRESEGESSAGSGNLSADSAASVQPGHSEPEQQRPSANKHHTQTHLTTENIPYQQSNNNHNGDIPSSSGSNNMVAQPERIPPPAATFDPSSSSYLTNMGGMGPMSSGTADSSDVMQILRDMQMAGSNVNPQMNFGLDDGLPQIGNGLVPSISGNGYNPGQDASNFDFAQYDVNILDNLPANGLNFEQWNTWFSNIDRMSGPAPDPWSVGMGPAQTQAQAQAQSQSQSQSQGQGGAGMGNGNG